jgi:lysozyme
MTRPVPQLAIDFIKGAEGCVLTSYRDSGGVWTIGYGHTGLAIVAGLTITQDQADAYLSSDLAVAAQRLAAVVTAGAINQLADHQYAALISFVFNLGASPSWNIWKVVDGLRFDAVPAEMMRFDKAKVGGQLVTVPGLIHRRAAEVSLWNTPDAQGAAEIAQTAPVMPPPSSTTRAAETPPTPDPTAKPLSRSKTIWTAAGTAAAGVVSGGQYVLGVAQPLKDNAALIAQCAEYASIAVVAGGVLIGAFRFMDEAAKHR